jgi:hypothetical protein
MPTKPELEQLAKEYLPDEETCDVMGVEELNRELAERRRQLVGFVEFVMEKKNGPND